MTCVRPGTTPQLLLLLFQGHPVSRVGSDLLLPGLQLRPELSPIVTLYPTPPPLSHSPQGDWRGVRDPVGTRGIPGSKHGQCAPVQTHHSIKSLTWNVPHTTIQPGAQDRKGVTSEGPEPREEMAIGRCRNEDKHPFLPPSFLSSFSLSVSLSFPLFSYLIFRD